jgi:hypothetical protein
MSKEYLVLSSANQAGHFQRSLRDASGAVVKTFSFSTGLPVEIDSEEIIAAISDDIGNMLLIGVETEPGIIKISAEKTDQVVLQIAKAKLDSKIALTPIQQRAVDLFRPDLSSVNAETATEPASAETEEVVAELDSDSAETPVKRKSRRG